jgi:HSP20 family protein
MLTAWNAASTLDRMFDDVMGSALGTATSSRSFDPDIDVRTSDDAVVFACDVPGMKQEDLDVTLQNDVLTIRGARKFEGKSDEYVVLGRAYGAFSRSFTLPDAVDPDKLEARLEDGVLHIRVPKQPKAQPRKIQIAAGAARQLEDQK